MVEPAGMAREGLEHRPRLRALARVMSALSTASLYIAGAGLVAMTVIVLWQVFVRFVLNWGQAWTELSSILIMSWFIFLGAAVGVRENYHLGFDVLLYILPKGSKRVLRTLSDLVVIAFAVGMIYYGAQLMILQWNERMPGLGVTGALRYLPLTVGGVLILLFSLERIIMRWAGINIDKDLHDEAEALPVAAGAKEL